MGRTVLVAVLVVLAGEGAAGAAQRADLTLSRLSAASMTAERGGAVRVTDTVRNAGKGRAKGVHVAYYLSEDARYDRADRALTGRRKVKALRPRKSAKGSRSVTVPTSIAVGAYRLMACADAARKVKERSERNNCRAAAGLFRVAPAGTTLPLPPGPEPSPAPGPAPTPAPTPSPSPSPTPGTGADFPLTPDPLSVTDTLETGRRVTKSMGIVESSLTATASDGTTYTLTMPQLSLQSAVDVTMTPVASIGGLPLSQGLIGAVEIKPHGLILQKAATLTIDAPAGTSTDGATAFLYHQGGEDFHLYPYADGLSLRLLHFSTPGFGRGTPADRANMADHPPARPGAQLEQSSALSDPVGHMASYYDNIVRNQLIESQNARTGMAQAIQQALAWQKQLQLLGLDEHEAFAERNRDLGQRIEILEQILFEETIEACRNHDLDAIPILMGMARQYLFDGGDEEGPNPMLDEALKCLNFEVRFDSTIDQSRTWVSGESNGELMGESDGTWRARGTVPIDHMPFMVNRPLTVGPFSYAAANRYYCQEREILVSREAHHEPGAPGTMSAGISLDLNPREEVPEGEPPPDPPQDLILLSVNQSPKETYKRWNEGCDNDPTELTYSEETRWGDAFRAFRGTSTSLRLPFQRPSQPSEVIHTAELLGTMPITGGSQSEETYVELWHTPKN